jgi:MHS family proline/betaine transporter-like MFS transporter
MGRSILNQPNDSWRGIAAICVGNAFEWFDFVIFGFFAGPISYAFFPADSPSAALLKTFALFGVTFLVRPIGALVAGHVADRRGRRPSLIITTIMMATGTTLIAFVPTYSSIGYLSAAIVVVARILQGFSAGGEFGIATALLAEHNPARRGFYSSWQFASQAATLILVTTVGAGLSALLTTEQIQEWGWRVPFIMGAVLGPIAIWIRREVAESHEFALSARSAAPLRETFFHYKKNVLLAGGLVVLATVSIYTLLFVTTFAVTYLKFSSSNALLLSLAVGIAQAIVAPIGGILSDRFGRRLIITVPALLILTTAIPLFYLALSHQTSAYLLIFELWIGFLTALYAGGLPALMSELFPTRIRTVGLSASYAIVVALFGGASPFVIEYAIQNWDATLAPSIWLSVAAVVSLFSVYSCKTN